MSLIDDREAEMAGRLEYCRNQRHELLQGAYLARDIGLRELARMKVLRARQLNTAIMGLRRALGMDITSPEMRALGVCPARLLRLQREQEAVAAIWQGLRPAAAVARMAQQAQAVRVGFPR